MSVQGKVKTSYMLSLFTGGFWSHHSFLSLGTTCPVPVIILFTQILPGM